MGEGFLRCPTALGHYATHGTINSTPTVGPEILPLLCKQPAANTQIRQQQIRKTGGGKYVKWQWQIPKWAGRQRRETPAERFSQSRRRGRERFETRGNIKKFLAPVCEAFEMGTSEIICRGGFQHAPQLISAEPIKRLV